MGLFEEMVKTAMSMVDLIRHEPNERSIRNLAGRIGPLLQYLEDDDPETKSFKIWANGMADGVRGLLNDEREMDSLGVVINQIRESLKNEKMSINEFPGDLNMSAENSIKLLIWLPSNKSTGHFACDLCSDSKEGYVSFWPKATKWEYWDGVHDCKMSTYEKDEEIEGDSPCVFHLHTLNKLEMLHRLEEIKRDMTPKENRNDIVKNWSFIKYDATTPLLWNGEGQLQPDSDAVEVAHNCCTVIWNLLVEGGIHGLMMNKTIFDACVHMNPVSGVGKMTQLAGPSVPKKNTTANPWSMFNLMTMAVYAENRAANGLPSLAIADVNGQAPDVAELNAP